MKKVSILSIFFFILVQPLFAAYQLVDHPRMFITKESLPVLAERTRSGGMLEADYAMMKAEADRLVAEGKCRKLESVWHRPTDMLCTCLVYLIERQLGNPNANSYAEAVKKIWDDGKVNKNWANGLMLSNIGPGHFGSFALCYDWIYDSMTAEERKKFGDYLGGWLYWYTTPSPEITLLNGGWLYNQTWGPAHLNTPNTRDGITPKLMVALAVNGAGTIHDAASKQYLDSWDKLVPTGCIPRFDKIGGVWSESMGHGSYGPVLVIPWAFEAWRTATGQDWFQLGTPTTFLKEMNRWAVHLTVPFSGQTAYIDDNSGGSLEDTWYMTGPILAARYRDPVANKISASFNRGTWPDDWFTIPWMRFLTYDPALQARTPGQESWATARLFTGAGHVYMRERWDDPNSTWAFFGAGPWYANHSRDDEGHFLIARKGWIVARAGGNGHNDDDYYAGGSLVYNIVTVFDPNETYDRLSPSPEALAAGGVKNERDGGTIRLVYGGGHDQVKQRGHITAFQQEKRWTYAAADLKDAYSRSKMNEITRQFLYLRGTREFFIIFDRVDAKSTDFPKTWFLHIPTEPAVDGSQTEITKGHVYSYKNGGTSTWLSDPAGISEVYSTGKARAFLKTVLPAGATITKRGGDGYEFWGHPHEPTAQYNHVGNASKETPVVPWRLEVEAPTGANRQYFLHVLEIGDENDQEMAKITPLESDTTLAGIRIEPKSGEAVEIFFSRWGTPQARIKIGSQGGIEQLPAEIDTTRQTGLRGDLDEDGRLSLNDVILLLLRALDNPQDPICDFNGDGAWAITDAVALLLYSRQGSPGAALAALPGYQPLKISSSQRSYLWEMIKKLGLSQGELDEVKSLIGPEKLPSSLSLYQNCPNPLNPSTTIRYSIPDGPGLDTKIEVYNLRGALVKVLVDKVRGPGEYEVVWNGKDSSGREVPSGVYFYRLRAGGETLVKKMVVLR